MGVGLQARLKSCMIGHFWGSGTWVSCLNMEYSGQNPKYDCSVTGPRVTLQKKAPNLMEKGGGSRVPILSNTCKSARFGAAVGAAMHVGICRCMFPSSVFLPARDGE